MSHKFVVNYLLNLSLAVVVGLGVADRARSSDFDDLLYPCYPDPFCPDSSWVNIKYRLASTAHVKLQVLIPDSSLVVETLIDRRQLPGVYNRLWRPEGLPDGIYPYRLTIRRSDAIDYECTLPMTIACHTLSHDKTTWGALKDTYR